MIAVDHLQRECDGKEGAFSPALFAIAEVILPILSLGRDFEKEKEAEVIEPIKGTLTVSF